MEKRKEGLQLTYIQFKEEFPNAESLKQERLGHKSAWHGLNNQLPLTVMGRYRRGLGDFTRRRQAKWRRTCLDPEWKQLKTFQVS